MGPAPQTVRIVDGTEIGFYEFGDPGGAPVLALHGVPACGAGFSFADEPARRRGIRVLAPDRPGVGLSTPYSGGTVSSYPSQVSQFADACGIERFAVWGYSGGGPFALGCGAVVADRVRRVAVTSGMGQVGEWAEPADFEQTDRMMLKMSQQRPRLARALMSTFARLARLSPTAAMKSFAKELSPSDQAVLASFGAPRETMVMFTGAFLRGSRGVIDDYWALGQRWDIDLAGITAPVKIFQGDSDTMVPMRHAEELSRRLPGAELEIWAGEGHLGTITHIDEILDWLTQPPEPLVA
jgi:pimeloyl-ACP methyl ester carboxylesterase